MHIAKVCPAPVADEKLERFLCQLTELSKAHGIGIDGEPQLFLFDAEDYWFGYAANEDDKLVRR